MRPDFKKIIRGGEKYNFHTHTQFCDGHDTMDAMARAAVDAGFAHIGFSPHSPVPIASPCNMQADDVPAYLEETRRLNALHEGRCRFYAGMEIDYLGAGCNATSQYYKDLGLDFSISSVHFIPAQNGELIDIDGHYDRFARNLHDHFRDDLRYVVSTFFERSSEMLAAGGFDILGHFDKIAQNSSYHRAGIEEEPWFDDMLQAYVGQIIDSGVMVEINTKARVEHGRFFPHRRLWDRLVGADVTLLVNSDAHYADRLEASRDEAFKILDTLGYGK